jgi:hypothetical protein
MCLVIHILKLFVYKLGIPRKKLKDDREPAPAPRSLTHLFSRRVMSMTISVGGDSDTIAAITGSIAEPYYGIPEHIWETACTYLKCSDLVIPLHNRPQMTSERASAARRAANEQRRRRQAALLAGIIQ